MHTECARLRAKKEKAGLTQDEQAYNVMDKLKRTSSHLVAMHTECARLRAKKKNEGLTQDEQAYMDKFANGDLPGLPGVCNLFVILLCDICLCRREDLCKRQKKKGKGEETQTRNIDQSR